MSAVVSQGPPSRLLDRALHGDIELVVPSAVLDELERVLQARFGFSSNAWSRLRALLEEIASDYPARPVAVEALTGDPADDVILARAVEARADVLVTGDRRHLLPLGQYCGVRILTPQAFLAELR